MKQLFLIALSVLATTAAANACEYPRPSAKAVLTIQDFGDFQCPYCAKGSALMEKVEKEYGSKVKVVFRNRPLASHPYAEVAAKAYLAVKLQSEDLAMQFHDELFSHQVDLETKGEAYLAEAAAKIGADVAKMKTDMAGAAVAQELRDDTDEADRNAIDGVPSFVIGSEKVTGAVPYAELKAVIEKQLGH